ncbi:MAG: hypothetical protein HRT88_00305 [Lentisphaeraceae bacterium]|nr:hypothetical protein [Lentisphaeraceae bacterium]
MYAIKNIRSPRDSEKEAVIRKLQNYIKDRERDICFAAWEKLQYLNTRMKTEIAKVALYVYKRNKSIAEKKDFLRVLKLKEGLLCLKLGLQDKEAQVRGEAFRQLANLLKSSKAYGELSLLEKAVENEKDLTVSNSMKNSLQSVKRSMR